MCLIVQVRSHPEGCLNRNRRGITQTRCCCTSPERVGCCTASFDLRKQPCPQLIQIMALADTNRYELAAPCAAYTEYQQLQRACPRTTSPRLFVIRTIDYAFRVNRWRRDNRIARSQACTLSWARPWVCGPPRSSSFHCSGTLSSGYIRAQGSAMGPACRQFPRSQSPRRPRSHYSG